MYIYIYICTCNWQIRRVCLWERRWWGQLEHHKELKAQKPSSTTHFAFWKRLLACLLHSLSSSFGFFPSPWFNSLQNFLIKISGIHTIWFRNRQIQKGFIGLDEVDLPDENGDLISFCGVYICGSNMIWMNPEKTIFGLFWDSIYVIVFVQHHCPLPLSLSFGPSCGIFFGLLGRGSSRGWIKRGKEKEVVVIDWFFFHSFVFFTLAEFTLPFLVAPTTGYPDQAALTLPYLFISFHNLFCIDRHHCLVCVNSAEVKNVKANSINTSNYIRTYRKGYFLRPNSKIINID